MKKKKFLTIILFAGFILCLGILLSLPGNARAAAKNNISCSVKNGTLTLSGKGAVSASRIKAKNKDRIKKIVVKQGITSIPKWAFSDFRKAKEVVIAGSVKEIGQEALPGSKMLKKVTMPGTFRLVCESGDDAVYEVESPGSRIDTVSFNTPLSLKTPAMIKSNHLIVSKGDKNYKSMDGVIYSRDGKSIVRVPAYRETLTVEEGCEEFCLQSVLYASQDFESDAYLMCGRLKKIILPHSVRTVNEKKYFSNSYESGDKMEFVVNTDRLDSKSIILLLESFPGEDEDEVDEERFFRQFPYVSIREGMCVNSRDACLIRYIGKEEEVTVPDDVKMIGEDAFSRKKIKRVVLPATLEKVDLDYMFDIYAVLTFKNPIEKWQTRLQMISSSKSKTEFRWQKITGVDGWQIQVSSDKLFRKKKIYYADEEDTRMKLTDRKMRMKYVRIRPYQTVAGKRRYGKWNAK